MECKYCAIDLETSGLNPWRCQVLEVACVVDGGDWSAPVDSLPQIHFLVDHGNIRGEPAALAMNRRILAELAKPAHKRSPLLPAVSPAVARDLLLEFWQRHFGGQKVVLAGKNAAGFDVPFLKGLWGEAANPVQGGYSCNEWPEERFHYRVLDPGMLYFDPRKDKVVPGLAECCKRAGIPFVEGHEALLDCLAVVGLLRAYYSKGAGVPAAA